MKAPKENLPTSSSGFEFFLISAHQQDQCAAKSREEVANPSGLRKTLHELGALLSLLDYFASCSWGCHGKEHTIEFLVGRTVSSTRASLRLIEFGHYDESLALVRGICEIGNLLWLFFLKPEKIREWIELPDKKRKSQSSPFSPANIRRAIEQAGSIVPHPYTDYAWLCETAVHPTPKTVPQRFNAHGIATLGGVYQVRGQERCVRILAWAVASVAGPASHLALIERSWAEAIEVATINLVKLLPTADDKEEATASCSEILERTKWLDCNVRNRRREQ